MQNSELKKELLGPHKEVSAQELENYLNGKLSDSEARAVEAKLNSSEFSTVAADGFSTYGDTTAISSIGKEWSSSNYSWVIVSSVCTVALIIAGVWMFGGSEPVLETTAENDPNTTQVVIPIVENTSNDKAEEPNDLQVSTQQPVEEKAQVIENTPKPTEANENSVLESTPVLFSRDIEKEVFQLKPLSRKDGNLISEKNEMSLKTQKARLRHYRNFKLVDQGIGIDQSLLKPILNGTEPFKETIEINPKYPEWMPADSVYKASVNEAIDWMIDENYTSAKMRFKRLLENTPEDLTATFYMGYTLFLNDEYEKALLYLNQAQSHMIQTYSQDARFIEIKCLLQLGRSEEAKKEAEYLKKIDSFYGDKALELVE